MQVGLASSLTRFIQSVHTISGNCYDFVSSSPAALPPADISTKSIKVAEDEAKTELGEEEKSSEEKFWPEPPERFSPPVRCVAVLPDDVGCPDGCECLGTNQDVDKRR